MQTTTPDNTIYVKDISRKCFFPDLRMTVLKNLLGSMFFVLSCSVFVYRTLKCSSHLEIIYEVETPDLRIGTLLVPAPVDDWTRGAGGVHPPGITHQQDNLHTVKFISTS